ncbi:MAG: cytidine deaminase [Oscillospiraceae bacterium]|nr:cytidine deaminase [Oscillospiraceae bacterium]
MKPNTQSLCTAAREATNYAYVPYSGFHVGAALLCDDDTIFIGCNVENASYSVTCCAERVAIYKAVSAGKRDFVAIAIAARKGEQWLAFTPCGVCRQTLAEFCGADTHIYVCRADGVDEYTLGELLPSGFGV